MNTRHSRPASPRGPVAPLHRGPQAQTIGSGSHHAPNAALLIDFDNVTMGIRSDLQTELRNLLSSDIISGKVAVQRAYADWRRYQQYVVPLTESSIDLIFAPAYGSAKKNATDIRLAIDALELVFTRPEIGTFILLSGDSDFSSLVIKLKEYGKYVIGVGIRESSSDLLVMNCDEYYSYTSLAGLVKNTDEDQVKRDPWELVGEAIARMARNGDVMRSDRLKQVMQDIDNTFDEKDLGFSKFSRFCQDAAQRGLISVSRMENGQMEVAPPRDGPVAPATAAPAATPQGDGEQSEERARRGRGRGRGRGRDREPRAAAATPADLAAPGDAALTSAAPADAVDDAAVPEQMEHAPPTIHREPAAAEPVVGRSGERLTRGEAFDLVRRAVQDLARGDEIARAGAVRLKAFELLGRDSESLSERNFPRILKDAHDGDVIDLRRRGDDYEVALAASAAPIAEQLNLAAAANASRAAAEAPPIAPAPRGMGPRGLGAGARPRGLRGRAAAGARDGGPPPELLSVGVVDDVPNGRSAPATAVPAVSESALKAQATGISPAGGGKTARAPAKRGGRKTTAKRGARAPAKAAAAPPANAAAPAAGASPPRKRGRSPRKAAAKKST